LVWFGIQVRHGLVEALGRRSRVVLEFSLLLAGIAALIGGMHLGRAPCDC
jgi:DMSO reductase anchor subunit